MASASETLGAAVSTPGVIVACGLAKRCIILLFVGMVFEFNR